MPVQWDEGGTSDLLHSMFIVLGPKTLGPDEREALVQAMKAKGHKHVTWNGIR